MEQKGQPIYTKRLITHTNKDDQYSIVESLNIYSLKYKSHLDEASSRALVSLTTCAQPLFPERAAENQSASIYFTSHERIHEYANIGSLASQLVF